MQLELSMLRFGSTAPPPLSLVAVHRQSVPRTSGILGVGEHEDGQRVLSSLCVQISCSGEG